MPGPGEEGGEPRGVAAGGGTASGEPVPGDPKQVGDQVVHDDSPTRKAYVGEHSTVSFDSALCVHAAKCVHGAPAVFDTTRRPWILPDAAPAREVGEVVGRCPSGALRWSANR